LYDEYELFYNQSQFSQSDFVHFVLREDGIEMLYDVNLSSPLIDDFNEIVNSFSDLD